MSPVPEPTAATEASEGALSLLSHLFTVTALLLQNSLGEKALRYTFDREELPALT